MTVNLAGKKIEKYGSELFFILEAGTNYYEYASNFGAGLEEAAKKFIDYAEETKADAIKFQAYKVETLVSKELEKEQYRYIRMHDALDYEDYLELVKYTHDKEIEFMITLFDEEGVEVLGDKLNIFKIASPDIIYKNLIKRIDKFGKPIILSTGFANDDEIRNAIGWIRHSPVVLLHCIPKYPVKHKSEMNLQRIRKLNIEFPNNVVGLSDHTIGLDPDTFTRNEPEDIFMLAASFGANVFEKHFKLGGSSANDGSHSINYNEATNVVREVRNSWKSYFPEEQKDKSKQLDVTDFLIKARRGIYAGRDYKAGETIKEVKFLRPARGITADRIDEVIGKVLNKDVKNGEPLSYKLWSKK